MLSASLVAIEWKNYTVALKEAKATNKIIMIDIVRDGCHYCEDMEKNVFANEEMSSYLDKKFIAVKINLDFDKLPLDINVSFTPTFYFLDMNQTVLKVIPGAWNIQDFKDLTENIK